jgi:hypothetical protein
VAARRRMGPHGQASTQAISLKPGFDGQEEGYMYKDRKSISGLLEDIAVGIDVASLQAREIPRAEHSNWREEVYVVYYVGKGKFSSDKNFTWDPAANKFEFYINLQMDGFDILTGKWFGYQLGVHHSLATVQDFLTTPPPPEGQFDDPKSPIPPLPVKEYTKGVWSFVDGSAVFAVGPAHSHLVPFKDGSFLFMVTTGQTITDGTGKYQGCAGTKQATGTAWVPPGMIQSGKFPTPGLEFEARTIETFRIVKKQDIGPFPKKP